MRKIKYFFDIFYPVYGGVQSHIDTLIGHMPNYELELITNAIPSHSGLEKYTENCQINRFKPVDYSFSLFKNKYLHRTLFPYRLLCDIIRWTKKFNYLYKENYDLLHVHGHAINMNFLRLDLRLNYQLFTKFTNFSNINKPKLLTLHDLYSTHTNHPFSKKYEEFLLDQFDNIICVDKIIHSHVLKYLQGAENTKNVWYIPNSIDTNNFKYTPFPNKEKLQVGFVGHLEERHGTKLLLEFAEKIPDWIELHIVAAGSDKEISDFKAHLDISKVHFHSNIKYKDMPQFYHKIDVLLNPVIFEAITRASLEAMACGRPVIMTNMGDRYPILNGKTGYIIENDIADVLFILGQIYENREANGYIGDNARKVINDEFSTKQITKKINSIYEYILGHD